MKNLYICGDKGRNYIISLTFWEWIVPFLFSLLVVGHFSRDYLQEQFLVE